MRRCLMLLSLTGSACVYEGATVKDLSLSDTGATPLTTSPSTTSSTPTTSSTTPTTSTSTSGCRGARRRPSARRPG
jgi:hypothetical protein